MLQQLEKRPSILHQLQHFTWMISSFLRLINSLCKTIHLLLSTHLSCFSGFNCSHALLILFLRTILNYHNPFIYFCSLLCILKDKFFIIIFPVCISFSCNLLGKICLHVHVNSDIKVIVVLVYFIIVTVIFYLPLVQI